jgi:hypothetical protein
VLLEWFELDDVDVEEVPAPGGEVEEGIELVGLAVAREAIRDKTAVSVCAHRI